MKGKLFLGQYLIWVILLLGQLHGCKSCIEKERVALLEIKKDQISRSVEFNWANVLPTWTNDTNSNCCQWEGIECNHTSRRVIGLFVDGLLPREGNSRLNLSLLHPFEEIRSLNLTMLRYSGLFDDIEGYKSLRRLRNLETLDLSSNEFNATIFPFLNAATSLTSLSLYGNPIDGPFPFKAGLTHLKKLKALNISFTDFSSSMELEALKDLTNLELLDLSLNGLNGSMPVLTHLKKLKSLDLSSNRFSSSMELQALNDLTNLELLDLSQNRLKGSMPELIDLKKLKSLDLSSNWFTSSTELQALKDLSNLEILDLSGNVLKGSMPELTHMKKLKSLDLSSIQFSSSMELLGPLIISELESLIQLEFLSLAENNLDGPIPIEVICKMKNLRELNLRGNHFIGQLPLCLGSLNKLRVLDLSSNQLSGNLPSSFGSLGSLEFLSLLDNNFTGLFSLNPLTNLTKLKVFKLSSRSRTVQIKTESIWQPKFQLSVVVLRLCSLEKVPSFLMHQKNLRLVDLSNNKLSGYIPTWLLENNPELEVLQLQNNAFTIFHMPPIMHNLQVLDFSVNDIRLFPDNIGLELPNLVHINGSNNLFQGNFPSSMGEMKNLVSLDLSYNNFSGELPRSFVTSCFLLKSLILSHNKFSGRFLPRRTRFSSVQVLRMDNNLFTGKIEVGLLSANNTLDILDVSYNSLTGAIPSWISKLSSVKYLLISNNFLEGTLPPSLLVMTNLNILDLSGNLLFGALPSNVSSINLFLSNNNFTGRIPDTLLETIEILDLRNNKLFGSIPQFVHTESIEILLLRGNKLIGSIPKHLCNLSNVRLLDLSNNQLVGFIPSCLNNLSFGLGEKEKMVSYLVDKGGISFSFQSEFYKSMFVVEELKVEYYIYQEIEVKFASKQRYDSYSGGSQFSDGILGYMNGMDLSNNELRGDIPTELGGLSKLRALNLSHNFLSSCIPSSFSNLQDIESLDLSHNMLDGKIPQQLNNLTSLAVLDVSYNNLSGIIPQGKQFNTFTEISYIGNPLLCGPSTDRRCETKKISEEAYNRGEEEDDEAAIDMLVFYYSVASTYVTAWIGILVLMCFDCPWRRAWLRLVDTSIASAKHMLPA